MAVNVAIVGATGAVGQEFLTVLAERKFPIKSLKLLASARSAGKKAEFAGESYTIEELTHESFKDVQIAFFSAGGSISKVFAPSAEAVSHARKVIAAYEAAVAEGKNVVLVDGKLVENLHAESARRLVALAEAIG